jgi:hypothetical protein
MRDWSSDAQEDEQVFAGDAETGARITAERDAQHPSRGARIRWPGTRTDRTGRTLDALVKPADRDTGYRASPMTDTAPARDVVGRVP